MSRTARWISDSVSPSHHEPLLVVLKLRSGDLRIFLQVGITCKLESADGILALRLLASRDDCYNGLPVGTAAVGDVGVQRVDHSGGTILQNSYLQSLEGGVEAGAIIQGPGSDVAVPERILIPRPLAVLADGKANGVLLVKVGEVIYPGGTDLTPSYDGTLTIGSHHGG